MKMSTTLTTTTTTTGMHPRSTPPQTPPSAHQTLVHQLQQQQSQQQSIDRSSVVVPLAIPVKLRHHSSTSTRSSNSTSSSLDDVEHTGCCQLQNSLPNEMLIDNNNQAVAIELPANTMRIELDVFRNPNEVQAMPGDIIEIDRTLFSHWAIYVGEGDVVHITGSQTQEVPDLEIGIVQRISLTVVAGDNFCRVNNKLLRARERNLLPFHNEIVVCKALSKVGSTVPYNVLQCNSEHYVTEWKFGQRWSDQAQVSLNSFKALRPQHSNSLSESHTVFVNTLNEVLNSPAISTPSLVTGGSTAGTPSSPTRTTAANHQSQSLPTSTTSPGSPIMSNQHHNSHHPQHHNHNSNNYHHQFVRSNSYTPSTLSQISTQKSVTTCTVSNGNCGVVPEISSYVGSESSIVDGVDHRRNSTAVFSTAGVQTEISFR